MLQSVFQKISLSLTTGRKHCLIFHKTKISVLIIGTKYQQISVLSHTISFSSNTHWTFKKHPVLLHLSHVSSVLYLHGESGSLLVVMVQYVGHEGGVVGQPLAHAQGDGLTGEQTMAPRRRIHGDGYAHCQHGHRQHPQEIHDWSVQ